MSNAAVYQEAKKLQQSSPLVELFVIDFTPLGGEIMRFFKGSNSNTNEVLWQGLSYLPFPCELSGVDIMSKGPSSRPTLSMGNSGGYFSTLCRQYADCVGVRFTRVRTFAKFLDGSPDADPTAFFPPDIFIINQKKSETPEAISFELISPMDLEDKSLPSRLFISNLCAWQYRSSECSYSANNVITDGEGVEFPSSPKTPRGAYSVLNTYVEGDYAYIVGEVDGLRHYYYCHYSPPGGFSGVDKRPPNSTYWTEDLCTKSVVACQLHHGSRGGGLPFGGFPAVIRISI